MTKIIDVARPIHTKAGTKATILRDDLKRCGDGYSLGVCYETIGGDESLGQFTKEGRLSTLIESVYDIENIPELRECWVWFFNDASARIYPAPPPPEKLSDKSSCGVFAVKRVIANEGDGE